MEILWCGQLQQTLKNSLKHAHPQFHKYKAAAEKRARAQR